MKVLFEGAGWSKAESKGLKMKYKILDRNYKLLEKTNDINYFMNSGKISFYLAIDSEGLKYFYDGTGDGFVSCKVPYKDLKLKRGTFCPKHLTKRYWQEKAPNKFVLYTARSLRIHHNLKVSLDYIQRVRELRK